jgi:hypothetical protein
MRAVPHETFGLPPHGFRVSWNIENLNPPGWWWR